MFLRFQWAPRAEQRRGGRQVKYDAKRQTVLNSTAHLVEIDLLRTGEPKHGGWWCGIRFWSAVRIAALLQNCIRLILRGAAALLLPLCTGEPVVDLHSIWSKCIKQATL